MPKLPLKTNYSDNFQTPREAFDILRPFLPAKWKIWECAWGKGRLYEYIKEAGFEVVGSDKEYDFLQSKPKECDCIITNPPYSLKDEFLERCYEIGKPFALLMPLTALEGRRRQKLYREYGISLIIPNKRFNFETPSGKGSGSWFMTAWYVWKIATPSQITFVEVGEGGKRAKTKKDIAHSAQESKNTLQQE